MEKRYFILFLLIFLIGLFVGFVWGIDWAFNFGIKQLEKYSNLKDLQLSPEIMKQILMRYGK